MVEPRTLRAGEAVALSSLGTGRRSPGELEVRVTAPGGTPDVVAFLLGSDGRVGSDRDLVFSNQPAAPGGAVRVDPTTASARIDTASVEERVVKVLVGCAGGPLDAGRGSTLRVDVSHPAEGVLATAVVDVPAHHRAENLLEVYRRGNGWRLRLLADGYEQGLAAMVRDHGVRVDDAPRVAPAPWPSPAPAPAAPPVPALPPAHVFAPPAEPPPVRSRKRRRAAAFVGAGAAALVAVVLGATFAGGSGKPSAQAVAVRSTVVSSAPPTVLAAPARAVVPVAAVAQAQLAQVPVKGRAPMTGYDRAQFGPAWADVDRNGCDTRNDVLRRDVPSAVVDPATHGCVVLSGTLADPYSGSTIAFTRGADTSADVQIDHVVALGDAWQTGAQQWDAEKRTQFANDPANLIAVDGPLNAQKGDGDAATWLPPAKAFRCSYVTMQVAVKQEYGLWVTPAEHDAIARVLLTCPGATTPPAPTTAAPATTVAPPATTVAPPPATTVAAPPVTTTSAPLPPPADDPAVVYYANCDAVRAAGKAPLYAGQPGYSRKLDRDGDGIACE